MNPRISEHNRKLFEKLHSNRLHTFDVLNNPDFEGIWNSVVDKFLISSIGGQAQREAQLRPQQPRYDCCPGKLRKGFFVKSNEQRKVKKGLFR